MVTAGNNCDKTWWTKERRHSNMTALFQIMLTLHHKPISLNHACASLNSPFPGQPHSSALSAGCCSLRVQFIPLPSICCEGVLETFFLVSSLLTLLSLSCCLSLVHWLPFLSGCHGWNEICPGDLPRSEQNLEHTGKCYRKSTGGGVLKWIQVRVQCLFINYFPAIWQWLGRVHGRRRRMHFAAHKINWRLL